MPVIVKTLRSLIQVSRQSRPFPAVFPAPLSILGFTRGGTSLFVDSWPSNQQISPSNHFSIFISTRTSFYLFASLGSLAFFLVDSNYWNAPAHTRSSTYRIRLSICLLDQSPPQTTFPAGSRHRSISKARYIVLSHRAAWHPPFFAAFATASQVSQSFASNLYHVSPVKRHSTPTENSLTTSCTIPVSILCCRFLVLFFILDATVPSHSGLYSAVTRLQLHVTLGLGLFPPQQPASRNASLTSHQHLAPCTVRCGICDPLADAFRCMTPQGSPVHHATACAPERRSFYCLEIQLHHHSSRSYFIIRSKPP